MLVIELEEETTIAIPKGDLSEDAAIALNNTGKFNVEFPSPINGEQYKLRSRGWVGHIPVTRDTQFRVVPKIPVANIFRMLEVAYKLKSFHLLDGTIGIESLEDLFERLASILAQQILDRARKGLFRSYLTELEDLTCVRGRIDLRESVKGLLRGSSRLHCEYQDHTADLDDNRILLWTLHLLPRLCIQRDKVRREVRQAHRALTGFVSLEKKEAADCIGRFYHRLNDDYQAMHGLCRFFLEHTGPGIKSGENEFIPFTLNMPLLFEAFVAQWLKKNSPKEVTVHAQYSAKLHANAELVFRIDIVLLDRHTGSTLAVLDTKYKDVEQPDEADIQQAAAYALEMGTDRAFLIYPSEEMATIHANVGHIAIESMVLDISREPEKAGEKFLNELLSRLEVIA